MLTLDPVRNGVLLPSTTATASGQGPKAPGFAGFRKLAAVLNVTAASGTSPTLDAKVQHSIDGGVTWFDLITFTQKTAAGSELKAYAEVEAASAQIIGDALRVSYAIGGTTPSFTFSVRVQAQ